MSYNSTGSQSSKKVKSKAADTSKSKTKPKKYTSNPSGAIQKQSSSIRSKKLDSPDIPAFDSNSNFTALPSYDDNDTTIVEADVPGILVQASKRPEAINVSLLVNRCLNLEASACNPDELVEKLNRITHMRLDRENICKIDELELLGANIRNLYLQHNCISRIEGLDTLTGLQFLALGHNHISNIENLNMLKQLKFLDLSHNRIENFDIDEIPLSLLSLSLKENLCQNQPLYRLTVTKHCAQLFQLDGELLSLDERREAGHDVLSESEDSEEEPDSSYDYNKPFDAEIIGVFDDLSADIFLRCQSRVQQVFDEHKKHMLNLESVKSSSGIVTEWEMSSRPSSKLPSRLNSPDTTDSSRPATGSLSQQSCDHEEITSN